MSIVTTGYKLEYVSRDLKFIKALMSTFRAVVFEGLWRELHPYNSFFF